MPEWYALLLSTGWSATGSRGVRVSPRVEGLTVEAVRGAQAGGVDVVAVNTTRDVRLAIRVAARDRPRSAIVLPMTAPALEASTRASRRRAGTPNGAWRPRVRWITSPTGRFRIAVPRAAAVLIRLSRPSVG